MSCSVQNIHPSQQHCPKSNCTQSNRVCADRELHFFSCLSDTRRTEPIHFTLLFSSIQLSTQPTQWLTFHSHHSRGVFLGFKSIFHCFMRLTTVIVYLASSAFQNTDDLHSTLSLNASSVDPQMENLLLYLTCCSRYTLSL